MEDSTKKEMTHSIEKQAISLNNNNNDIEAYKKINHEIINIINNISKDYDFKNFNKENYLSIEKVIINYIITFIYIVFN